MTDENATTAYDRYRKAITEANVANKALLFEALAAAGITSVTVAFDGEGDSGQIQDITALSGDNPTALPDLEIEIRRVSWGSDTHELTRGPVARAIEDMCYDYLSDEHGGWENSGGAYGEFTFSVARRTVELEFHARYTDTFTSTHTF
jgi:hypothetical protein